MDTRADALAKSIGAEHRLNAVNAPTVLNAALQAFSLSIVTLRYIR